MELRCTKHPPPSPTAKRHVCTDVLRPPLGCSLGIVVSRLLPAFSSVFGKGVEDDDDDVMMMIVCVEDVCRMCDCYIRDGKSTTHPIR